MKKKFLLLTLVVSLCGVSQTQVDEKKQPPVELSPLGLKRIQKNLDIVLQNIEKTQSNIQVAKTNFDTVQSEINELKQLEREHEKLEKDYLAYITNTKNQFAKNKRALARISKLEDQLNTGGKEKYSNIDESKDLLNQEKYKRGEWTQDAEEKFKRVNQLLGQLRVNRRKIQSRRPPLEGELKQWESQKQKYESRLNELLSRKQKYEQMKLTKRP